VQIAPVVVQFCVSGYVKQSDITRAFGVTPISVKRSVKLYREKGTERIFHSARGAAVLVDGVVEQVETRPVWPRLRQYSA
jgi:hypothetical protein